MIRLSKSCIGKEEKLAVVDVLDSEYLGMGQNVKDFEYLLERYFDRPAVCVNTGTSALHLSVQCCGIGKGDEVIVPTLTYVASFQAISAAGAKPIPCDIDLETLTIDVKDLESKISSKTKAIMPVHLTGAAGHLQDVYKISKENNLRVIEDAAHAFGSFYENKLIGSFGDIACFSFDGIKNITSGEGGCIVSNDDKFIQRIKDARLLGVRNDTDSRYQGKRSWCFDVTQQGWRYHMSNINAAIGIEQFKKLEKFKSARQYFAKLYDNLLSTNPKLKILKNDYSSINPHIYIVQVLGIDDEIRNDIRKKLLDCGVETGIHYQPNHKLSFFKSNPSDSMINANKVSHQLISLPLHPDLTKKNIHYIAEKLQEIIY